MMGWRSGHHLPGCERRGRGGRLGRVSVKTLNDLVAPDWAEALAPVEERVSRMGEFLRGEIAAGRPYLPAGENVLRAFTQPLNEVKVLIVGQDPYPTPGHPVGLSFSVAPDVRPITRTQQNNNRERMADVGLAPRQGLGGRYRAGDPRAGEAWRSAGGDPLGPRRADPQADARQHAVHRERAPEPDVRRPRLLRLPPIQPRQRTPGTAGRHADRLASPLRQP